MLLTFSEDFSNSVNLDVELVSAPESGLYLNKGVHPYITVNNLLAFLPRIDFTFTAWSETTIYGNFNDTFKKTDIVTFDDKIYLSRVAINEGNIPDESQNEWLLTNIESLRLRSFIRDSEMAFKSSLSLQRRLIENQYIEHNGEVSVLLNDDFHGWCFEPKGSDYVNLRINNICLQALTTDDVNLYVVNNGEIKETVVIHPNNGAFEFENVDIVLNYKGKTLLVYESQQVKCDYPYNDELKYDSFVCYPVIGTGLTADVANYSDGVAGNGLSFNISSYIDPESYITVNKQDFARAMQLQFEFSALELFANDPNNRINSSSIHVMSFDRQLLLTELKNTDAYTVASKLKAELNRLKKSIDKTFDKYLQSVKDEDSSYEVEVTSL